MSRGTIAYIDLGALSHNVSCVKALAPNSRILAMIKSNAYGHGLIQVAQYLSEVDAFGVACLDEALSLRTAGIVKPIVVMAGCFDNEEVRAYFEHDFTPVLHSFYQVEAIQSLGAVKPINAWIKVDTGMHRLGFAPDQLQAVYQALQPCGALIKPLSVMTHLSDADNVNTSYTFSQLNTFMQFTQAIDGPKSIANSAAILFYPVSHLDWVRPGIMMYGVSPRASQTGADYDLKPAMTLTAKLIAIKKLRKGDSVGYGCKGQCPEAMNIGVVSIGYGDGYPRHAKNGTPTLLGGQVCPLIGRVSMDMITIDLRAVPGAAIGDEVTLWGKELPVETVARHSDTIGYELLCGVTRRVQFCYE